MLSRRKQPERDLRCRELGRDRPELDGFGPRAERKQYHRLRQPQVARFHSSPCSSSSKSSAPKSSTTCCNHRTCKIVNASARVIPSSCTPTFANSSIGLMCSRQQWRASAFSSVFLPLSIPAFSHVCIYIHT